MVNENAAHHLCRHAKEMGTVLLLHLFLVHSRKYASSTSAVACKV
jgi:hypothetical protein